jgi:hypothetical protein
MLYTAAEGLPEGETDWVCVSLFFLLSFSVKVLEILELLHLPPSTHTNTDMILWTIGQVVTTPPSLLHFLQTSC